MFVQSLAISMWILMLHFRPTTNEPSAGRHQRLAIFAHPLFLNQGDALAAIAKLALEVIPQDPSRPEYRQGSTLGDEYKHWFRAKFFQQYRLFFRYHQVSKIIVYAWLNDTDTKRAYDSAADAYRVFRGMLEAGHPADGWDALLVEARAMRMRLANATGMLVQE